MIPPLSTPRPVEGLSRYAAPPVPAAPASSGPARANDIVDEIKARSTLVALVQPVAWIGELAQQIPGGRESQHCARHRRRLFQRSPQSLQDGLPGARTELAQQRTLAQEDGSQHARDRPYDVAIRDLLEHFAVDEVPELERPSLGTGRAEGHALAAPRHQHFVAATGASYAQEAVGEHSAVEEAPQRVADMWPPLAILPGIQILIGRLKHLVMVEHERIQRTPDSASWTILDGR